MISHTNGVAFELSLGTEERHANRLQRFVLNTEVSCYCGGHGKMGGQEDSRFTSKKWRRPHLARRTPSGLGSPEAEAGRSLAFIRCTSVPLFLPFELGVLSKPGRAQRS